MSVENQRLTDKFASLSTLLIADAALRLRLPVRFAPASYTFRQHLRGVSGEIEE
jgi:hypothetical protein